MSMDIRCPECGSTLHIRLAEPETVSPLYDLSPLGDMSLDALEKIAHDRTPIGVEGISGSYVIEQRETFFTNGRIERILGVLVKMSFRPTVDGPVVRATRVR